MSDLFNESEYGWREGGPSSEDVESATRSCFAIFVMLAILGACLVIFVLANWLR